jgi:hypothetical protein
MVKETTQKGACPGCGRPYIAAVQVDDAAGSSKPAVTVHCPHQAECQATFPLGVPNGAEEETLSLYTPLAWAELRRTEIPAPLTGPELAHLELQNDVTGLSTVDIRRLLADNRRLRRLVIDAEPHVPDNEQTRTVDLSPRLKAQVRRG